MLLASELAGIFCSQAFYGSVRSARARPPAWYLSIAFSSYGLPFTHHYGLDQMYQMRLHLSIGMRIFIQTMLYKTFIRKQFPDIDRIVSILRTDNTIQLKNVDIHKKQARLHPCTGPVTILPYLTASGRHHNRSSTERTMKSAPRCRYISASASPTSIAISISGSPAACCAR